MIPSIVTSEILNGLCEFIETGWEASNETFKGSISEFAHTSGNLHRGPYLSLGLPFRTAQSDRKFFDHVHVNFRPFMHQLKAWERLTGDNPSNTVIATGTGSGKTECFLFPILEYCSKHKNQGGVKAIIIYPMNALAGDQSNRIAKIVHSTAAMRGLRAGLYVGEKSDEIRVMTEGSIITSREEMLKSPPDILLTNYRMLDYLLVREKDSALWHENVKDSLNFIAVDELHTFDGAQGTDLALLLRRLKARLESENAVCIGTSATLGSGDDTQALVSYAQEVFKSDFSADAIITEDRMSMEEFTGNLESEYFMPDPNPGIFNLKNFTDANEAVRVWYRSFFGEMPPENHDDFQNFLAEKLRRHVLFNILLTACENKPASMSSVYQAFRDVLPAELKEHAPEVCDAFLAIVSQAKNSDGTPFLNIRIQIWIRELRRMVANLTSDKPVIICADDLDSKSRMDSIILPVVQCSECHMTGWVGRIPIGSHRLNQDLRLIYNSFFNRDPDECIIFPDIEESKIRSAVSGEVKYICPVCGEVQSKSGNCTGCQKEETVMVFRITEHRNPDSSGLVRTKHICPYCASENTLLLFGARSASISSVALQHLWASSFNDHRKLIAFSDSVQDAAHRAGFFSARTWHSSIRMAIFQALKANGGSIKWTDFLQKAPLFWLDSETNPKAMTPQQFVTEFIGPNMHWLSEYEDFINTGNASPELIESVKKRFEWEIFAEFTYNSRLGRSLERTGCATLFMDTDSINKAVAKLKTALVEGLGIRTVSNKTLNHFIHGIVRHMILKGGVFHPFTETYIKEAGREYLLNRLHHMPGFSPTSRKPVYISTTHSRGGTEMLHSSSKRSWYQIWTGKCFQSSTDLVLTTKGADEEILNTTVQILEKEDILKNINGFLALNEEKLFLTDETILLTTHEGAREQNRRDIISEPVKELVSSKTQAMDLMGMPVLDIGSTGAYKSVIEHPHHWLKTVYEKGVISRVIASEHTGLLERKVREELEGRFNGKKQPPMPFFENLLSATPTLEMGIDIGSLSSVLMCQVPPSQANYLQRTGRAGRRDGNSIAMTIAGASPHDLYFYADPVEMMAGHIQPPGVYLNASKVLERQLVAYCFDNWVKLNPTPNKVPLEIGTVLNTVRISDINSFPFTFMEFVRLNSETLFSGFRKLVEGISENTLKSLGNAFLSTQGGDCDIMVRIIDRLTLMKNEVESIKKRNDQIRSEIKILKGTRAKDEALLNQIKEMEQESQGLSAVLKKINSRQTFEFFTDEGLLPNYAFPESGVILKSIITKSRKSPGNNEKEYTADVYEYERPGRNAISELAPDNRFYASGRKVTIDQIDMNLSEIEQWRFCQTCSHAENLKTGDLEAICPVCGDPMWKDTGQKLNMIRLTQVMARTSDRESRILDDAEDRQPTYYQKNLLPDFKKEKPERAHKIDNASVPFGFEFIRHVALREINFGKLADRNDKVIRIAGKEASRPGFPICIECGKVQKGKTPVHTWSCKKKNSPEAIQECLYLYREFESEAVRILLPATHSRLHDKSLHSMIAAIQLGLKLKFGGKVDHILITSYEEHERSLDVKKTFILLYDSVPGGTGYLHQLLLDTDNLKEVFQLSSDHMKNCSCAVNDTRDGCYRCLFAYRLSHGMELTSRKEAVSILDELLEHWSEIKEIETIKDITVNYNLESELEQLFVDKMSERFQLKKDIIKAKSGWSFKAGDQQWKMIPQWDIRPSRETASRPDFVLWPEKGSSKSKPAAVFLDGWKYHDNRVTDDTLKRMAIAKTGQYAVFTITWDDLEHSIGAEDVESVIVRNRNEKMEKLVEAAMAKAQVPPSTLAAFTRNNFILFQEYLHNSNAEIWAKAAFLRCISSMKGGQYNPEAELLKSLPNSVQEKVENYGPFKQMVSLKTAVFPGVDFGFIVKNEAVNAIDPNGIIASAVYHPSSECTENQSKKVWKEFWATANLLQFLPFGCFVTAQGLESGIYDQIQNKFEVNEEIHNPDWQFVLDSVIEDCKDGIKKLASRDYPLPEVGKELYENETVVAEAELAWNDFSLAVVFDEEQVKFWEERNWKVIVGKDGWEDEIISCFEEKK